MHNFSQPHKPNALQLRGLAIKLRDQMRHFDEDLQTLIPSLFDSEEYRARSEQISAELASSAEGHRKIGSDGIAAIVAQRSDAKR